VNSHTNDCFWPAVESDIFDRLTVQSEIIEDVGAPDLGVRLPALEVDIDERRHFFNCASRYAGRNKWGRGKTIREGLHQFFGTITISIAHR
jgi:hypothetical protein